MLIILSALCLVGEIINIFELYKCLEIILRIEVEVKRDDFPNKEIGEVEHRLEDILDSRDNASEGANEQDVFELDALVGELKEVSQE